MVTSLQLKPSSVLRLQLWILGVLIVLNFVSLYAEYYVTQHNFYNYTLEKYVIKMFSFFWEHNVPTYFSTLNLFISAGCLYYISKLEKRKAGANFHKHWLYLSRVFVFLAFDELLMIHELFITPSKMVINHFLQPKSLGVVYHTWVVPYILALALFGVYFYKFVFSLPARFTLSFILAGAIFVFGAVGVEMIEGSLAEVLGEDNYRSSITFKLWVALEESLEILGIMLFIYFLMQYIEHHNQHKNIFVTIGSKKIEIESSASEKKKVVAA
ncbi:hypothetical protein [Pontibacter beigongshangensis]|uniref:hypothetical protein n=1 Tax=Pontibacter beigongshangensis TaxID=2574733 RepID=UPI00164FA151|nr:hypothetical protein [Pontibacter beigongshangensis]